MPPTSGEEGEVLILVQGAVLTFFAFIGFEDTFNVAEECRNPQRTIPLGLILAIEHGRDPLYRGRGHRSLGRALA